MVTQSATLLERHLLLGEPPPSRPGQAEYHHQQQQQINKRKQLAKEDPMSHRIIEKRRRDRMNNCLADLSRLIPADYMKKGRGRIEKTEIIEMAIKHMKQLQDHHASCHLGTCEMDHHVEHESEESFSPPETKPPTNEAISLLSANGGAPKIVEEHYRLGYHECLSETMHFLVEVEGMFAGDKLCVQLISHLQRHCDNILKGGGLNAPRVHTETTSSSSMGSKERCSGSGSGSSSDGGERPVSDGFYSSASQLRDILTSSHRLKIGNEPLSPSNSMNGASSHAENLSSTSSLYKFKNNIKQRFSAEHSEYTEQSEPISLKRRRSEDRRIPCEPLPVSSPPPAKPPSPPSLSHPSVPIFALHSNGRFYIPLTVDHHVLSPFLTELSDADTSLASIVLHPVTISVKFQQSFARTSKQPPWHSSPSPSPHGYLPLPKWACAPNTH